MDAIDKPASSPAAPATLDPDDPYAREAQTFPRLSAEMLERVAAYGVEEPVAEGAVLFARGQRSVDFLVVLDGRVEIFDAGLGGKRTVVRIHNPGEFTGE